MLCFLSSPVQISLTETGAPAGTFPLVSVVNAGTVTSAAGNVSNVTSQSMPSSNEVHVAVTYNLKHVQVKKKSFPP